MRATLILMIGMVFWLVTPAMSDAHQAKKHDNHGYSNQYDGNRGHEVRNKQQNRQQNKGWEKHRGWEKKQAWKKHRKAEKHWAHRQQRHQAPVRVVYRDRWPFPLFPRIVINIPL